MNLSQLLHGFVTVASWIRQSWSMYFLPFAKQNQAKVCLTKISKLVEASALNLSCWMSQSTQCLGSVVPLAMFLVYVVIGGVLGSLVLCCLAFAMEQVEWGNQISWCWVLRCWQHCWEYARLCGRAPRGWESAGHRRWMGFWMRAN